MYQQRKHIIQDTLLIALSIVVAVFIVRMDIVARLESVLDGFTYLGIFMAGMLFFSAFTAAPSVALLGGFAQEDPVLLVAFVGGLGAVIGDYIIFRFVRDRIAEDLAFLFRSRKRQRFLLIFRTGLFRFLVPFIGALIVASPFPDEIGIAMLGLTRMRAGIFLPLSFFLNSAGIMIVGLVARSLL